MFSRESSHPSIQHGCCFMGPLELPLVPPHFSDGVSLFCEPSIFHFPREEIAAPESREDSSYHHNSTHDQVVFIK